MTTPTPEVFLCVTVIPSKHHFTLRLEPCLLDDESQPRWFSRTDYSAKGRFYANLVTEIWAWQDQYTGFVAWSQETEYKPTGVRASDAQAMLDTFKAIDKYLAAARDRDGSCTSVGTLVLRMVRALGAAGILVQQEGSERNEGWRTLHIWHQHRNGQVVAWADYRVNTWAWNQRQEKAAEVSALATV